MSGLILEMHLVRKYALLGLTSSCRKELYEIDRLEASTKEIKLFSTYCVRKLEIYLLFFWFLFILEKSRLVSSENCAVQHFGK